MDNNSQQSSNDLGLDSQIKKLPNWTKVLFAIGGAVIVVLIAVGVGGKYYYQVSPLSSTSTPASYSEPATHASSTTQTTAKFEKAFASAQASQVSFNSTQTCSDFSADDPTHNLATTTLLHMGQKLCNLFVEKGRGVIASVSRESAW